MGVTIADFQSSGNLPVDILLFTSTVSSLPMASGQVLVNLIGSLSQPVAFLESSLQMIEITTSSVTAVRSKRINLVNLLAVNSPAFPEHLVGGG